MQVKKLSFADFFTLGRIAQKLGGGALKGLVMGSGDMESNVTTALMMVLEVPNAEEDVHKLLASVTGQTVEQVKEMDPIAVLDAVETMIEQEDWGLVFQRLRGLLAKKGISFGTGSSTASASATVTPLVSSGGTAPQQS